MTFIQTEPKKIYIRVEQTGPVYKTYEELIAMSKSDVLTELNTYPTIYFDMLNSEGHLYRESANNYWISSDGTLSGLQTWSGSYIGYNISTSMWQSS